MTVTQLQEETVPLKSRIAISAGDAATAILQSMAAAGALTYYFVNLRGLDAKLAGIVWLLFGIWNAINDPLFGYISDRTKNDLGRRVPYIRYGAPIFAIGFLAFWIRIPGTDGNQTLLFIQLLLSLLVYDILYTAIGTSFWVLPYEIAVSNKARSSIYVWKIMFMVLTIVVPFAVEATIKPDVGDMAGISFFRWAMIGLGVVMALIIFASTYFFKENHYAQAEEQFDFIKSFKECFANRSFVVFEVLSFTIMFVQTALMQGIWYYFDVLNMPRAPLLWALGIGIVLGVVAWIRLRDRLGVKLCTQIFTFAFAIGCVLIALLGRDVTFATVGFFLFGVGFSGGMYLIPLMNGDVVDMDEHRTGLRREGMYAGINSFITKPAISIAMWSLLTIMANYGYNDKLAATEQSYSAGTGVIVGWGGPAAVLLFLSFLSLFFYPLAGTEWNVIKGKLALIHKEKERKYLESMGYKLVE